VAVRGCGAECAFLESEIVMKQKRPKMHAGDIEIAIAHRYGWRRYFIVPNVHWGLNFWHELDMLVVSPVGWATEIEIKVSASDLKADKKKIHGHRSDRIRQLYFAVPEDLRAKAMELIPERAGLIIVKPDMAPYAYGKTEIVKTPKTNSGARKLNEKELQKLGKLAAMRIWSLKAVVYRQQREKVKLL